MAAASTYLANKMNDHSNGVTSYTMPTVFIAAIRCTAGSNVASPRSVSVTTGQTTVPATANGHMYRCTTAGITGGGEPTWPTTSAGTVTDGTAIWTEMTPDFQANNSNVTGVEANYTGYGRAALAGLMGSSSSESATNSSVINYAACTGGTNLIGAWVSYDAATVGNALKFAPVNTPNAPLLVSSGITPNFAIGALITSVS